MVFWLISTLVHLNSHCYHLWRSDGLYPVPDCSWFTSSHMQYNTGVLFEISQLVILEFTSLSTLSYLYNIRTCIRTKTILVMPWLHTCVHSECLCMAVEWTTVHQRDTLYGCENTCSMHSHKSHSWYSSSNAELQEVTLKGLALGKICMRSPWNPMLVHVTSRAQVSKSAWPPHYLLSPLTRVQFALSLCEAGRDTTAQTAKVRHADTDMCICMCSMHTKLHTVLDVGRAWEWSAHNSYHVHRWNCISIYGAHGILDTASTIISLIPYVPLTLWD